MTETFRPDLSISGLGRKVFCHPHHAVIVSITPFTRRNRARAAPGQLVALYIIKGCTAAVRQARCMTLRMDAMGLMSTIRGCSPLYRCSESILAHNMRTYTHARTRTHARTHARPRTLTHTRTRTLPVAKLSEFPFLFLFVNMSSHFGHSIFAKRARSWKRMYSQYCLSSTEFHALARCGLSAGLYSLSFGALLSR